ncbi:murein L,D-transpeptidase catalytic domain family protein [Flavobacterium cerinum]|uniref:Murein L,D-transpeptidase catalytic domain family protein n=1 Tax=Flavobacterium cerinum TaxID=2502784 RepID=A0A444GMT3_9FLAO|nr:murein L,D-transpeptidase catalytic domain family protein [Flavobacterium cerinum]RWW92312.1 murein L,D-transpeptidase catalytic domain family protein [Flavobacterium cerinum]
MVYNFFTSVFLLFFSLTATTPKPTETAKTLTLAKVGVVSETQSVYNRIKLHSASMPQFNVFEKAVIGFKHLKEQGKIKKDIITLIDFSLSSNAKRLWIIDMATQTVLYNTLVAHGKNSGDEFATAFSNASSSNKSSLGFYATGEIYKGKHGESLRLDGLENGINSNARSRAVVMHAADYVSDNFIKAHKRLGRSQGCPALPAALNKEVINLIKDKSCLFIYHPSQNYEAASKLLS